MDGLYCGCYTSILEEHRPFYTLSLAGTQQKSHALEVLFFWFSLSSYGRGKIIQNEATKLGGNNARLTREVSLVGQLTLDTPSTRKPYIAQRSLDQNDLCLTQYRPNSASKHSSLSSLMRVCLSLILCILNFQMVAKKQLQNPNVMIRQSRYRNSGMRQRIKSDRDDFSRPSFTIWWWSSAQVIVRGAAIREQSRIVFVGRKYNPSPLLLVSVHLKCVFTPWYQHHCTR